MELENEKKSAFGYAAILTGLAVGGASVAMGYFPVAGSVLVTLGVGYFAAMKTDEERSEAPRASLVPSRPSIPA
jgi:hypothetical protein